MNIVISNALDIPFYRQIVDQLRIQIVRGELAGGSALPPIRTVAKELRISVITVKRAWEELEHDGYIHTVTGKGCFVAPRPVDGPADRRLALAAERLQGELPFYRKLGLTADELTALIRKYYGD